MPSVKALLVAVVGQSGAIEAFLSPPAAANLARNADQAQIFAAFAAEVEQAAKPLKKSLPASRQLRFAWLSEPPPDSGGSREVTNDAA